MTPALSIWSLRDPIVQDSLDVKRVSQLSVPVGATVRIGRLTLDAGGAYATGEVRLEDGRTLTLAGITDVRVRGVVAIVPDRLLVTVGLTAPTGLDRLSQEQVDALGVIGAPGFGFAVPTLGNGFGATGGLVLAWKAGPWAFGLGSSVETRGRYTAVDAVVAGVRSPTDLDAGMTYRASFGADRLIGKSRLSLLFAGDYYGTSRLATSLGGSPSPVEAEYQLGPSFTGSMFLDLGAQGVRSLVVSVVDRYRSRFTGLDGTKAVGSNGNRLDAGLDLVTGSGRTVGFSLRVDGRLDSGLEIDNSITTAAMTSGGLSLGVVIPAGRLSIQPFVRGQIGRLDAGPQATTAFGYGGGLTIMTR